MKSLAFSTDGIKIVSGSFDKTLKLREKTNESLLKMFGVHQD